MALAGVGASRTAVGVRHNLDIKDVGYKSNVGDDCRAKLMYYLLCFSGISKFDQVHPELIKYTKYENYKSLSIEEEEKLLHICRDVITLHVAQAVGFIEVPDGLLESDSNKFFEVTNTDEVLLNQVQVHIDENSIYAGNVTAGAKRELKFRVMIYKRKWIYENYYNPLRELPNMIMRHKREKREIEGESKESKERRLREIKEAEERKERIKKEEEERKEKKKREDEEWRKWIYMKNEEKRLREIKEAEERKERIKKEEEERKKRKAEERKRRIEKWKWRCKCTKISLSEEEIRKKRYCCCILSDRIYVQHPNLIKSVIVLYFIHAVALFISSLHSNKDLYEEAQWLKWIQLAGFIILFLNSFLGLICITLVFISYRFDDWMVYVRILIEYMMALSIISIPLSYFMFSYFVVSVVQVLISITLSCFSCVIFKEMHDDTPTYICCGKAKVSPETYNRYFR